MSICSYEFASLCYLYLYVWFVWFLESICLIVGGNMLYLLHYGNSGTNIFVDFGANKQDIFRNLSCFSKL